MCSNVNEVNFTFTASTPDLTNLSTTYTEPATCYVSGKCLGCGVRGVGNSGET